ncbi:MAG: ATP-binding protein, partial [Planctomycetes bacterium]|nr:ATP-binding protein [Planctomycetota bacterium]
SRLPYGSRTAMPQLSSRSLRKPLDGDPATPVVELALNGFIDAANFVTFEKALQKAAAQNLKFLLVNFAEVHYINSSGISALISHNELYRSRGGLLCLAGVAQSVGISMHLLGVTNLIPFTKDLADAHAYVRDYIKGKVPALPSVDDGIGTRAGGGGEGAAGVATARRTIVLKAPGKDGREKGTVMVLTPSKTRFTRILQLRFGRFNGRYHLVHHVGEALHVFDQVYPDLVVVDDRCDPGGEFINRVKIEKERSLTSIIKLYGRGVEVKRAVDFKIWENDYLVDPFETLEFFSLTEAELARVPKDRKVFQQQVHFEFASRPENVEKAYRLCERVIHRGYGDAEGATALYAAVKEGIDNAVVHGNRSSHEKTIDVNFLVDHQKVTVLIEDQGEGFDFEYYLQRVAGKDAFEEAKRRILEAGARGGLGILLMSRCTDRIDYAGSGNILRLEKNLR